MHSEIRSIVSSDKPAVTEMMRVFYTSPCVLSNGSEEIFETDINTCLSNSPYLEGYVFEGEKELQGYAMVAKSYSTEFGKQCIWIEDLYIKPDYRGIGIGSNFLRYISKEYPDAILRLEVEEDNTNAINVYKKAGFEVIPYMEMKK